MNRTRVAAALFLVTVLALLALFLGLQVRRSGRVSLWMDETFALLVNSRQQSALDLAGRGAAGQGSPSPLTYLIDKGMDRLRGPLGYLGLSYAGYYRFGSGVATGLLGLAAVLIVARRLLRDPAALPATQLFVCACALATFYFNVWVYEYASESRPYSYWNSLWFLALAVVLHRPVRPALLAGVMTAMALTATASCFQILALGAALGAAARAEGKGWREAAREAVVVLGVPMVVAVYYALHAGRHHWEGEEYGIWPRFLKFWTRTNRDPWLVTLAAGALLWLRPSPRKYSTPVTAMGVLLLLGPLIFGLTRARGFFYHSRQYIYYSLAVPVVLLALAAVWPAWVGGRKRELKTALLALVCLCAVGLGVERVVRRAEPPKDTVVLDFMEPGSGLLSLLAKERPRALCFEKGLRHELKENIHLLAEWIQVRAAKAPVGGREVWVREAGGRLVADVHDAPLPAHLVRLPLAQ